MALLSINDIPDRVKERFWTKVFKCDPDECWPWHAGRSKCGYGKIGFVGDAGRRDLRANRVALVLSGSNEPFEGAVAMHSCDNPPCCNPNHLRWGSAQDNARDCAAKGRNTYQVYGFKPPINRHNAKFTEEEVRSLRAAFENGESQRSIARRLGVDKSTIRAIRARDTYAHVD